MSAKEIKNPALPITGGSIGELANLNKNDGENKENSNVNSNTNVNTNKNIENDSNENTNNVKSEADPLAAIREKITLTKKKESNKPVTILLTPKNHKRLSQLKQKGQKSDLVNQLLDLYFED